jgi:hypothetical protein
MAARVTSAEVIAIMPGVLITGATVDLYIESGTLLIDSVFGATNVDDLTKQIEKWFVAHMIASTQERMTIEEKIGDASVKYHDWKGEGLNSTPYGQMVLLLDRLGLMTNMGMTIAWTRAVKS